MSTNRKGKEMDENEMWLDTDEVCSLFAVEGLASGYQWVRVILRRNQVRESTKKGRLYFYKKDVFAVLNTYPVSKEYKV